MAKKTSKRGGATTSARSAATAARTRAVRGSREGAAARRVAERDGGVTSRSPAAGRSARLREEYEDQQRKRPRQSQNRQPGIEAEMKPQPESGEDSYRGSGKLLGKAAIITGGDSGIGRAVAVAFAREGADVAIVYLNEHQDARETTRMVEEAGRRCIAIAGDVGEPDVCHEAVERAVRELGRMDIVVNNAAEQHEQESIENITPEQLLKTFQTNIFSCFYMVQAAMRHLGEGAAIINTTSVTAYRGSDHLIDYASTKGAIVAFTRSLATNLAEKNIRVNAVAPGPIWTPLIAASFEPKEVKKFGSDVPMKRAGQPAEVAPSFVFLASDDSIYMTGQVLHPNGGEVVNG
ncbi:MAG: glucose 1-dehydrogenase [Phycisphaerales bacterium]|nr:glucose 1-dehydrogenase [Phycisphaerales bacterium]